MVDSIRATVSIYLSFSVPLASLLINRNLHGPSFHFHACKQLPPLNAHLHSYTNVLQKHCFSMQYFCILRPFSIFLHTYLFSAFRFVNRYVCRFQKHDKRSELLENGRVDSKPSQLPENESSETNDGSNGKTRSSSFLSLPKEIISSTKLRNSESTCGGKEFDVGNVHSTLACIHSTALDDDPERIKKSILSYHVVSKETNSGVLESKNKILDIEYFAEDVFPVKARILDSENSASNVFDSLPEPEVQGLREDYSNPSDSEPAGDSTDGSPKINHQVDLSSKEIVADINVGESKQLDFLDSLAQRERESVNVSENSTETMLEEKPSILNFDFQYELNYLPDHQDIVQQLEMELRNIRTGGLPTIFEEETEVAEAIDEKIKYEERMVEIQKVYRTYAENMWKLDILNNQSMHATGLLQLKYPVQSISEQKYSVPIGKSPLPQNPLPGLGKERSLTADPMLEFLGDLRRDMELVYVGQVCLSWEILQWQLRKALELQRHDSQGKYQYSQVASEFQLFQVMLKRFMQEERFQGHRVESYVQNRCVFRSFLQVPAIKDGGSAEANGREWEDEDGFSRNILAEIIEKSMWVFYEFLLSDKDDGKNILKSNTKYQIELQNSENPQPLLVNIQTHFQKAERRLKDLLRGSNNCSAEKLEKQDEAGLSYSLVLLIAQVDLKLISRVLRMSKLAVDQLLWCNQKLDQIKFVNRKVHLEPSFLLFPF